MVGRSPSLSLNDVLDTVYNRTCRWRWPRGLRHELSSPARTLASWVRISLEAWMSVCVYSVFVLSCMYVAALRRADPPSKESYRMCIGLRNWKSGQGPTKGCRAIDEWMNIIGPMYLWSVWRPRSPRSTSNGPRSLPSKSVSVNHSSVTLPFDTTQSKILSAS
jgi:hypothetical protein